MVKCVMCGNEFEPKPEELKAFAESGADFDPTDWECPTCEVAYDSWLAAQQSVEPTVESVGTSPAVASVGDDDVPF